MKTYLITGATGFLGGLLTKKILQDIDNQVILPVRNLDKAKKIFDSNERIHLIESDVEHLDSLHFDINIDYIIHAAATTTSKIMIEKPVEVCTAIVDGTRNVLEIAKKHKIKSMVYLSSMEAYGSVPDDGTRRTESETGYISLTSTRSCYPLGKQMAELLCTCYAKEYGTPVTIARLSQVFGQGVSPDDTRVFMQFAKAAKYKKDIVLKTKGLSYGNYTASEDAVEAILYILRKGKPGETYNVVNESNTMRIREMAEFVCKEIAGGDIDLIIDEDLSNAYAADTGLKLSGKKLSKLGYTPTKDIKEMYYDLLDILDD